MANTPLIDTCKQRVPRGVKRLRFFRNMPATCLDSNDFGDACGDGFSKCATCLVDRCNFFGGLKRMMGSKNFKLSADIMGISWLCTCR